MRTGLKTLLAINPIKTINSYVETSVSLLRNVSNENLLTDGTVLHGHLLKTGVSSERFIAIKLLIMYLNSRKSIEADQILNDFGGFDLVAHNCMINASIQWGNMDEARKLFDEMPKRNEVSWTVMISGLMKHGRVEESMRYFYKNPFQNLVSVTAAITGLAQNGFCFNALKLFLRLLESSIKPNTVTFSSVIRACGAVGDFGLGLGVLGLIVKAGFEQNVSVSNSLITLCLRMGETDLAKRVFDQMEKKDVVSWTAILDVYVEMGNLQEARRIFDEMPERNKISWSAMIARYAQNGYYDEAWELFLQMVQEGVKPNISCFSCILSTLASLEALKTGTAIHGYGIKLGIEGDVFLNSSLLDLYCKCKKTEEACLVFDSILEKNVVSWNSMVSGYSLNGQTEEAKELFENMPIKNDVSWSAIIAGYLECEGFDKVFVLFNEMLVTGEIPNKSAFSSVLRACASIASLEKGKDLHGKVVKLGIQYDVFVGTALMDMYAKSGDIGSSKKIFDRMPEKDEISWTVMIQGLAENGFAEESVSLFEEMERTSLIILNDLLLLSVLFACSHAGLVDKGCQYFKAMETVYHIKPKGRHYTCLVDMLSRSGRLTEAENFINSMPFQPETNAWAALLNGCKIYRNEEIAERTARKLFERAEKNSAGYVLLSNIYASAGRWMDVATIRKLMKEKGLKKSRGCSWIELKHQVHSFFSEDGTNSQSAEIYRILKLVRSEMMVY